MTKKELMMNDQNRYKKKSKTASISKSTKRANHKHDYGQVIIKIKGFLGFQWGRQCRICGRMDKSYWFYAFTHHADFMKPESTGKPAIGASDYFSAEEIHQKYPGVQMIELDGDEYKEI